VSKIFNAVPSFAYRILSRATQLRKFQRNEREAALVDAPWLVMSGTQPMSRGSYRLVLAQFESVWHGWIFRTFSSSVRGGVPLAKLTDAFARPRIRTLRNRDYNSAAQARRARRVRFGDEVIGLRIPFHRHEPRADSKRLRQIFPSEESFMLRVIDFSASGIKSAMASGRNSS
jgi:hypothetical protein